MSLPVRHLFAARRHAVTTGEVRRMWPGAAWDVATLVWFRGILRPIQRRIYGPSPDERYHSPTGGCPLCNPSARIDGEAT